jgi:hypothetical protein
MWLRCVALTLLVYLVFYASYMVLQPFHLPYLLTLLPSMVAAMLVGVHLRSWAWVKTPLVVGTVVATLGGLVMLAATLEPVMDFAPRW